MDAISKEQWDRERAYLDPVAANGRLQTYAQWLFASATVLSSIGTLLSMAGITPKVGGARNTFVYAVVALGASLVLAGQTLVPIPRSYRLHDRNSAHRAVQRGLWLRASMLTVASVLFATAITLVSYAGLSGLNDVSRKSVMPRLTYKVTPASGQGAAGSLVVEAHYAVTGLPSGSLVEIRLDTGLVGQGAIALARSTAGDSNVAVAELANVSIVAAQPRCIWLRMAVADASGKPIRPFDSLPLTDACHPPSAAGHPIK